jgi:cell division protein FtsA
MFGTRLEANVHIITTAESAIGNVLRCFERMNIGVNSIFLQNIADARAVLSDDEKELGVLLLDIGAETTNVSVYYKQAPLYTTVFQKMGGDQITFDLSKGFGIPLGTAEKLKCEMGVADYSCVDESAKIQIPAVGGRPAKIHNRSEVVDYIQPRLLEIFGTIRERLKENDLLECINGGVVIIGGTALLPGIEAVAQQVFGVAVRVGALKVLGGLGDKINSPEYSVVNGVLELGAELANYEGGAEVKARRSDGKDTFMNKVSDFFKQFF